MTNVHPNSTIRWLLLTAILVVGAPRLKAQNTLPTGIGDDDFWKLIGTLSEPDGNFQSENLLSNETDFPQVMASLQRRVKPEGAYLGVGPEQNFNYIAATRPRIAFIIDIRRQNMIEHLLYKAIFELSPNRAAFISRLFSRKQPGALPAELTAAELFDAYSEIAGDDATFKKNLAEVERLLITTHRFSLNSEDRNALHRIYEAFYRFGPLIDYNSLGGGPSGNAFRPSYAELMTQTDYSGKEWSYLASEDNYGAVRDLESRNLIIPITGDFGGPKAIRAVGRYLSDHGAVVSVFYTSNVEGYLFQGGDRMGNSNGGSARFYDNAATLPLDDSSTFIRWIPRAAIVLEPIQTTVEKYRSGQLSAMDFFRRGRIGGFANIPQPGLPPGFSNYRVTPLMFDWTVYAWILFHILAAAVAFFVSLAGLSWSSRRSRILSITNETPRTTPPDDPRMSSRRRIIASVAWAIGGYAAAAIFELSLARTDWLQMSVHLNRPRLIFYGVIIAANTALLVALLTFGLLAKLPASKRPRLFAVAVLCPLLLVPVFGIQVASDINRGLDLRTPVVVTIPVLQRSAELYRYYIHIDPTTTGDTLPERIEVPYRIYNSVIEGDTIPVVIGRGVLGIPWYRSINGLSMNN